MSRAVVENIIKVIETLSEEDRELLDERLAAMDEARWQQEVAEARRLAAEAGVDQAHIDQTIQKLRYG